MSKIVKFIMNLQHDHNTIFILCFHRAYGGGSIRSASLEDLNRKLTLKDSLGDTVKDLIVMSLDVQKGINPCANNNGGCEEICLFTGDRVKCQCYHARIDEDGKSCKG